MKSFFNEPDVESDRSNLSKTVHIGHDGVVFPPLIGTATPAASNLPSAAFYLAGHKSSSFLFHNIRRRKGAFFPLSSASVEEALFYFSLGR